RLPRAVRDVSRDGNRCALAFHHAIVKPLHPLAERVATLARPQVLDVRSQLLPRNANQTAEVVIDEVEADLAPEDEDAEAFERREQDVQRLHLPVEPTLDLLRREPGRERENHVERGGELRILVGAEQLEGHLAFPRDAEVPDLYGRKPKSGEQRDRGDEIDQHGLFGYAASGP